MTDNKQYTFLSVVALSLLRIRFNSHFTTKHLWNIYETFRKDLIKLESW